MPGADGDRAAARPPGTCAAHRGRERVAAVACSSRSPNNNEVVIKHINVERYIKGRSAWDPMAGVELYDPIVPSAAQAVMEWVRLHHESVTGRDGYADFYKRDCQLKLLDPVGTVVELWDIKGAFLTEANFNDLSYDGSDLVEIAMTLRFDNCVLQY